ncbi:hypothetical protein N2152v2_009384 [Parachlorella kessleri]
MKSDDEYLPDYGEDDEAEDADVPGNIAQELDEEDYLRGALTAEEEDEDDLDEGGQRPIFLEGQDPLSVLAGMEEQDPLGRQPFELLAAANQRQRSRRVATGGPKDDSEDEAMEEDGPPGAGPGNRKSVFGAGVDDIWNDPLAEKLGLDTGKGRRRKRNKEKWKRRAARKGIKSRDLPEEVAAKLGQANLLYASQKHEEAIALLMEVIRLAPNLPDPYHTLGLLHEAVGNAKKALDFYMIAAHITPKDLGLWKRLAEMSSEQGLVRQAIYCLTQILRRDKDDLDARYDRALLYAELEDDRKAIESFEQVQAIRPDHPEVPKALARLYHRAGQAAKAMTVIESHMERHPGQTDLTHVNILAELYGEAGRWDAVLDLIQRAEQDLCGEGEEEEEESAGGLPVDLQVKAGLALAQLGQAEQAAQLFSSLLQEPVDQFADLYADVGGMLLGVGQPAAALQYYRALAEHPVVGQQEAWWARMAVCHRAMCDTQAALHVYEALAQRLPPGHPTYVDAKVAIADLHKELGQGQEADKVLNEVEDLLRSQELLPTEPAAAAEALLRRASILLACGKHEAYLDLALPVLGTTLRALERETAAAEQEGIDPALRRRLKYLGRGDEEGLVFGYQKLDRRKQHIRELDERVHQMLAEGRSDSEGEAEEGAGGFVMRELLREEGPFMLLLQSGQVLVQEGRHSEARELMQAALDVWADRWKRDALRLVLFEAALAQRDFSAAQRALRPACARWPYSPVVWNAYARYLTETGSIKQSLKHLQPLRGRHPASLPLMLLLGHCQMLNSQYGEALGEYFHAWRVKPEEPLVLLCIAAALVNQATTRRVPDRHRAVLQAFAFLQEYSKHRRNPQASSLEAARQGTFQAARCSHEGKEAAYNIARAAHHLNLLHIAVPFYERALDAAPTASAKAPQPGAAMTASPIDAQVKVAAAGAPTGVAGATGSAAARARPVAALPAEEGPQPAETHAEQCKHDLRCEAAYNLSLIYRSSGADELARQVLRRHLTL